MELRVLQYFLAVAREESVTGAANALHLSQPTLSRQLKDMEEALGKRLFIRGGKRVTLTEEGKLLRRRAEEILSLVQKTEDEISAADTSIRGDVYIGAGETAGVGVLTAAMKRISDEYPDVRFHIISGDRADVLERLDSGLIDLGLIFGAVDLSRYDATPLPVCDTWGVLMRRDDPLSEKPRLQPEDLYDAPLIVSRQSYQSGALPKILGKSENELHIVGTYSLLFNGSLMVRDGLGYALCLDGIVNVTGESELTFRPLPPRVREEMCLVYKKNTTHSKAANLFLTQITKKTAKGASG